MRYCPFLPYMQGEPSECLSVQCMMWSEQTHNCSFQGCQAPELSSSSPLPKQQVDQSAESLAEPKVSKPEPIDAATSEFGKWLHSVKTGGDGTVRDEQCSAEERQDNAETVGGPYTKSNAIFGTQMTKYEEVGEFEDTNIDEQLAGDEQITCAGCGRQLPKGAMWCPKCNG